MNYDMNTLWDDIPFISLDTETTGFQSTDRIVEIGLALFDGNEVADTYTVMVDPRAEMNKEAMEVTGITPDDYKNCPYLEDIVGEVVEWLTKYKLPWVAHNMEFDTRMLSYDIPKALWPLGIPTFCTMKEARKRKMSKANLAFVASALEIPQTTAHRALADAVVCGHIARRFTKGHTIGSLNHGMTESWVYLGDI